MERRFIKLPVMFASISEKELESKRAIYGNNWTPELEPGFKYFNIDQICDFNEDTDGQTTLCMASGDTKIYMKFEEFLKLITE